MLVILKEEFKYWKLHSNLKDSMTNLELKRIKVELLRVCAAKAEIELRVEEQMENIKRLQENIVISSAKEEELKQKIAEAEITG